MSTKADSISGWSILQLLKLLDNSDFCLVCRAHNKIHRDDCEMKRHIDRLEVETRGWNPAQKG